MSASRLGIIDVRCAIYTRKSHTEGLEQSFNSLDAQRLACSHYIASQASEGWSEHEGRYDDAGVSGGTLARPALQRLLGDVASGSIDTVVVYKIDRLSRSLRDFVRLVEVFERHRVTFVSITQQFSTTSSMGRLTLNVLLSFAQFEREITSERTRDKFALLREKGIWTTGVRPYGYRLQDRLLVVHEAEAAVVRRVHDLYLTFRSAIPIAAVLNRDGLKTHHGQPFNETFVRRILQNRLYCGERAYRGKPYPGIHKHLISERIWARTEAIKDASPARRGVRRPPLVGLLEGLLYGRTQPLVHVGSRTKGKLYRYYEPQVRRERPVAGPVERFRAHELEQSVLAALDPERRLHSDASPPAASREFVRSLVNRIDIGAETTIRLKTGNIVCTFVMGRTDTIEVAKRERRKGRFSSPFVAEVEG